jgi:RNA polymerase sigma-70 factor (ECF subfamily)
MLDGSLSPRAPRSRPGAQTGEDEVSDDTLLARIAHGDGPAWTLLVNRHLAGIVQYANYLLRDRSQAEDIAQETFIRVMRKAKNWEPGGAALKSWLYRVARNLCIDHIRKKRPIPVENIEAAGTPLHHTEQSGSIDRDLDLKAAVRSALATLPERQQSAIVMVHYQGFSGTEAADALDISVDALESLLARGRRILRQQIEPALPDLLEEQR